MIAQLLAAAAQLTAKTDTTYPPIIGTQYNWTVFNQGSICAAVEHHNIRDLGDPTITVACLMPFIPNTAQSLYWHWKHLPLGVPTSDVPALMADVTMAAMCRWASRWIFVRQAACWSSSGRKAE